MKDFKITEFSGDKVQTKVPRTNNISVIWQWDNERNRYYPPKSGLKYIASRRIKVEGKNKQQRKFFSSLDDAKKWQNFELVVPSKTVRSKPSFKKSDGITFQELIEDYFKPKYTIKKRKETISFDKRRIKNLAFFNYYPVDKINDKLIDAYLSEMTQRFLAGEFQKTRTSFDKELECLSKVLNHYREYHKYDFVIKTKKSRL